jgi:hypothetical protein
MFTSFEIKEKNSKLEISYIVTIACLVVILVLGLFFVE